jgi:hypothetical protein
MLKELITIMKDTPSKNLAEQKTPGLNYLNEDKNKNPLYYLDVNDDDNKIKLVDIIFDEGDFEQQIESINETISILDGLTKQNTETENNIYDKDTELIGKIIHPDNLTGGAGKLIDIIESKKQKEKERLFEQTKEYIIKNINMDDGITSIIVNMAEKTHVLQDLYIVLIKLMKFDERSILNYYINRVNKTSEEEFNKKFENLSLKEFNELLNILIPTNDYHYDEEFILEIFSTDVGINNGLVNLSENTKTIMKDIILEKYNARNMSDQGFVLDFDIVEKDGAKQENNTPNFFDKVKNIVKKNEGAHNEPVDDIDDDESVSDTDDDEPVGDIDDDESVSDTDDDEPVGNIDDEPVKPLYTTPYKPYNNRNMLPKHSSSNNTGTAKNKSDVEMKRITAVRGLAAKTRKRSSTTDYEGAATDGVVTPIEDAVAEDAVAEDAVAEDGTVAEDEAVATEGTVTQEVAIARDRENIADDNTNEGSDGVGHGIQLVGHSGSQSSNGFTEAQSQSRVEAERERLRVQRGESGDIITRILKSFKGGGKTKKKASKR